MDLFLFVMDKMTWCPYPSVVGRTQVWKLEGKQGAGVSVCRDESRDLFRQTHVTSPVHDSFFYSSTIPPAFCCA